MLSTSNPPSLRLQNKPKDGKESAERERLTSFENRTARSAVRHVVLAVHGIGQRMGGRTIADDAQDVRERVNHMLDEHMADEVGLGYVQVLPVQWRKNLDLEVRSFVFPCPCFLCLPVFATAYLRRRKGVDIKVPQR